MINECFLTVFSIAKWHFSNAAIIHVLDHFCCSWYVVFSPPVAMCDDLTNITNGVITYSPASSPRLETTTATYSCSMGLDLFGAETRTCQNERTWSGMEPYCQR